MNIEKFMDPRENPEDYKGEGGLLFCGKCHTPKQIVLDSDPFSGRKGQQIVPVTCKCERESRDKAEKEKAAAAFEERMKRLWAQDGIHDPTLLEVGNFADDDSAGSKVSFACHRYVDKWERIKEIGGGILLCGPVGTGKSFYASAICNALLEKQVPVAATSFPRLLNQLQNASDRQERLDRLRNYHLLMIDDLGTERESTYAAEQVFSVIDARMRSKLPTIITTNLTLKELEKQDRIYDRVLSMCIPVPVTGESRRKENAKAALERMRVLLLAEG